jgi:hypothetical protein
VENLKRSIRLILILYISFSILQGKPKKGKTIIVMARKQAIISITHY